MITAILYGTAMSFTPIYADGGYEPITKLTLARNEDGKLVWDAENGDEIGIETDNLDDAISDLRSTYSSWPWRLEWDQDPREYTDADIDA
jgi:hypothetical protein